MIKPIFCSSKYYVDSAGIVFNQNMQPIPHSLNHKGYCIVVLNINGCKRIFGVHTLVARAFCAGYQPGMQVNHKDGVKTNNDYTNLEWMTGRENTRHSMAVLGHTKRGKHNPKARAIIGINQKDSTTLSFDAVIDAARYFAGDDEQRARRIQNCIWKVLACYPGKNTYRGYIWKYANETTEGEHRHE